ncbi:MAG: hypothetical protein LBE18_05810 [Planctomycetaceae bacterium]|jgi:enamine deaminase RidA (YjgF/YER057c/UK114 family)|nr:hypothetical protein [Planctomycetaceae bacterium]
MRKTYTKNITYSVVPFGTAEQMFLIAEPAQNFVTLPDDDTQGHGKSVPDWQRQIYTVFHDIRELLHSEGQGFLSNVVMSNFYLADIGMKELLRQIVTEVFPNGLGAMTIIPQAPIGGGVCGVEIWAIAGKNVKRKKSDSDNIIVTESDSIRWFFGGNFRSDNLPVGAYNRSLDAFKNFGDSLIQNKFQLDQVIRTWIYQGHLVLPDKAESAGSLQRYQELNRARTDFFGTTKFLSQYLPPECKSMVFPASTGIGADDIDVVIAAIAVDTKRKDFIAVPLENPNQTSAFSYSENYSPQSPKFARGMAVTIDNWCQIFVSGTASITDSESRFGGDPASQTEQTLDNIAALIDSDNLTQHGIKGFNSGLDKFECVRVYIKNSNDFNVIDKICKKRLTNTPTLYTIADVCRPELLVEIEGFAVTTK